MVEEAEATGECHFPQNIPGEEVDSLSELEWLLYFAELIEATFHQLDGLINERFAFNDAGKSKNGAALLRKAIVRFTSGTDMAFW